MAAVISGVYPVYQNKFKVGKKGKLSTSPTDMAIIADMESFSLSMDNNIEEWTPLDTEGWVRRLQTGKGFGISLSGKRCVGDAGNDYVAGLLFKNAQDVETKFEWEFPDGTIVKFDCVINVTNVGTGDSTGVGALEFEVLSNGKPTITEPSLSE